MWNEQLTRMMARHRKYLSAIALRRIGEAGSIEWLDTAFTNLDEEGDFRDSGIMPLGRLESSREAYERLTKDYASLFSSKDGRPGWDAVGMSSAGTLLFLNAISTPEELASSQGESYSAILDTLLFLDRNHLNAKHLQFFIPGSSIDFEQQVFRFKAARRGLLCELDVRHRTFIAEHLVDCCLSPSGEILYEIEEEGRMLYKDWYIRSRIVVCIGGFGLDFYLRRGADLGARFVLIDTGQELSDTIRKACGAIDGEKVRMLDETELSAETIILGSFERDCYEPPIVIAGIRGATTRRVIESLIENPGFAELDPRFVLLTPLDFQRKKEACVAVIRGLASRFSCRIVDNEGIMDSMEKGSKIGVWQERLMDRVYNETVAAF